MNILILDDGISYREMYAEVVEDTPNPNLKFVLVSSLGEALTELSQKSFDIFISDLFLEDKNPQNNSILALKLAIEKSVSQIFLATSSDKTNSFVIEALAVSDKIIYMKKEDVPRMLIGLLKGQI